MIVFVCAVAEMNWADRQVSRRQLARKVCLLFIEKNVVKSVHRPVTSRIQVSLFER